MTNLTGTTNDPKLSAVFGQNSGQGGVGTTGISTTGDGVRAVSTSGNGLSSFSTSGTAVFAQSQTQPGVSGISTSNDGVRAVSTRGNGLSAFSTSGTGLFAKGPVNAGFFEGNVAVTGDITLVNADLAEDFSVARSGLAEPGTVMALNAEGEIRPSRRAYEKGVVGVVSGAGSYKPAIVMDKQESGDDRQPISLVGKAYCKVDAQYGAVEAGDLLTTSPTPGHAMKAGDPLLAFGSVIGKALRPWPEGLGLVPILIALQ